MGVSLVFLTPLAALLAAAVLLPLCGLALVRRRAQRARGALGLGEPPRRRLAAALVALLATAAFIGTAAAQPVLERTLTLRTRTDAEAFVVLDVSRSMLAQHNPGSPMRIERAKVAALTIRDSLQGVPVGVASMTDRVLPHLFPSVDEDVFQATVERSLGIEQPPPRSNFLTNATKLDALATVRTKRYFTPQSRKRLLVVLTDGETQPVAAARLGSIFRQEPAIDTIFVQFWRKDERVFSRGTPEPQYLADPSSRGLLDGLARAVDGTVYDERDVSAATQKARALLGDGPTVVRGERGSDVPLAPYFAAVALLPIAYLLRRPER
jgi:hypothetical protein